MSDYTSLKRCPSCGCEFPRTSEYFHHKKTNPDGLYTYCKECACQRTRAWYKQNPEKAKILAANYVNTHREQIRRYSREWARAHNKQLYAQKREQFRQRRKKQYTRERDTAKRKAIEWYENNKERAIATAKINTQRRNARKRSLPNTFTVTDWADCLAFFDNTCAVCGRPQGLWHTLAMDHWIPLSDPNCPGTVKENIVPLCHGEGGCNNSKGNSIPHVWLIDNLGKYKARKVEKRILEYFARVSDGL